MRDDDLLVSLQMADRATSARGRHEPGSGTDLHIGIGSLGSDAEMVSQHEAAHLELNYVTAYGLLLRATGSQLDDAADRAAITAQLAGLIGLCPVTHEIFATTTGVRRSHQPSSRRWQAIRPTRGSYAPVGRSRGTCSRAASPPTPQ